MYSCHLFLISSASLRSIPFLSFINPIFAWNVPLVSLIFLKRSLVFPVLLFSSISLHWSLRKAFLSFLAILWNSAFKWEYLSFSPSPGQNTGVGSLSLLQGIFPTRGLSTGLPHCRPILYQLSHKGSPQCCSSLAYLWHILLCSEACELVQSGTGIELVSFALQGVFLTTGLPGKPSLFILCLVVVRGFSCGSDSKDSAWEGGDVGSITV